MILATYINGLIWSHTVDSKHTSMLPVGLVSTERFMQKYQKLDSNHYQPIVM